MNVKVRRMVLISVFFGLFVLFIYLEIYALSFLFSYVLGFITATIIAKERESLELFVKTRNILQSKEETHHVQPKKESTRKDGKQTK